MRRSRSLVYPAIEQLVLLRVSGFSKYASDESEQLLERVKPRCLVRRHVLNPALESPCPNIGFGPELDDEGPPVLPILRHKRTIFRRAP